MPRQDPVSSKEDLDKRLDLVKRVISSWRSELIDVSGGNKLLFYSRPRVSSLDLTGTPKKVLEDLYANKPVRISQLKTDTTDAVRLHKSLKALQSKAKTALEEFGLQVLYLAHGFVSWTDVTSAATVGRKSTAVPNAPLFLWPVYLQLPSGNPEAGTITLGDFELNNTLLHYLLQVKDLRIDVTEIDERAENWQEYQSLLLQDLRAVEGFSFEDQLILGAFGSSNQSLLEDLSDENLDFLTKSDGVSALAGSPEATEKLARSGREVSDRDPDKTPSRNEFLVLDADASQSYVVNAVSAGQNLVVQGPPGTGKSQTIANVIASQIPLGKRILFVAQKKTAIDAVLRRLEAVNLDHLTLDLEEDQKSRRYVLESINAAIRARQDAARPDGLDLFDRIDAQRDRLVHNSEALSEIRSPWGLPLVSGKSGGVVGLIDLTLGVETRITRAELPNVTDLLSWSQGMYELFREDVRRLYQLGGLSDVYSESETTFDLAKLSRSEIAEMVESARLLGLSLKSVVSHLDHFLEASTSRSLVPDELVEIQRVLGQTIRLVLDHGDGLFRTSLNETELLDYVETSRWKNRLFGGKLRRVLAKSRSEGLRQLTATKSRRRQVKAVAEFLRLRQAWQARSVELDRLPFDVPSNESFRQALSDVLTNLPSVEKASGGRLGKAASVGDLLGFVETQATLEALLLRAEIQELRNRLTESGLRPFLRVASSSEFNDSDSAVKLFDYMFAAPIVQKLRVEDERIRPGQVLSDDVTSYSRNDLSAQQLNVARIRRMAAERLNTAANEHPDQFEIIAKQMARRRGFLPVRELLSRAENVMLAAKPVWTMSPSMASKVLPRRALFDLVIFDEASQVELATSIPAIARGRQIVVVGDDRQLPPDRTFKKTIEVDVSEADIDDFSVVGVESVLQAMEQKLGLQRSRHLQWHYRSEDERLIATSNEFVYKPIGRSLIAFPSSGGGEVLVHHRVSPSKGISENNLSPIAEVNKVADMVEEHVDSCPNDSLGVIAPGVEHMSRIIEELDRRAISNSKLQAFMDLEGREPFFVKNLERVQGDERDRVIISIGYGHRANGVLSLNWGPINALGGERRVNVAISRAKKRMDLVTSFSIDEVRDRGSAPGFQLIERFIHFVGTGGVNFGQHSLSTEVLQNPMEFDVYRRLLGRGLEVIPQYGVGVRRIDFAIMDPSDRSTPLLAVEFDGASYHSHPAARERDRLRQSELERRGWVFHRIWSTDYFDDPDREIDKVEKALKARLRNEFPGRVDSDAHASRPQREPLTTPRADQRGIPPLELAGEARPITSYTSRELDSVTAWIQSDGLLRTNDEIVDEAAKFLGYQRLGQRIRRLLIESALRTQSKSVPPRG